MANTRQAIKRVRQALRRRTINKRTRSAAKSLVQKATRIVLGQADGDAPEAVASAVSALDKAAAKGIIHPNNAARRKSRLISKANAAHLLDAGAGAATGAAAEKPRSAASKAATRRRVAASKASKAAAGRVADRPRTAAGKAKVAVTRASRETRAETRRGAGGDSGDSAGS